LGAEEELHIHPEPLACHEHAILRLLVLQQEC
jgi:hypothetical protein